MNSNLEKQEEFQKLACQEIPKPLSIPSLDARKRRLNLALEELTELAVAFGLGSYFAGRQEMNAQELKDSNLSTDYNQLEAFDALLDIEVINNGSIIECGFVDIYPRGYDLVNDNNMSKGHYNPEEAEETAKWYRASGVECGVKKVITSRGTQYSVIRAEDGKLLKPKKFINVGLSHLLQ